MDELTNMPPQAKAAVSAAIAALFSFGFLKGLNLWQKIFTICFSFFLGWVAGEAVDAHFTSGGLLSGTGAVIGLFGRPVCEKIFPYLSTDFINDVRTRIRGQ